MSVGGLLARSIPLMESTGSYVMVVDTANLKSFIYGLPNIKLSYIYIFHQDRLWTHNRPKCNPSFEIFNNLIPTNSLGPPRKPTRKWTWHSPDGKHNYRIEYVLVRKRFRSGVNIHRIRSFLVADRGSDRDLATMLFRLRLKKTRKQSSSDCRLILRSYGTQMSHELFNQHGN